MLKGIKVKVEIVESPCDSILVAWPLPFLKQDFFLCITIQVRLLFIHYDAKFTIKAEAKE